jgi:hypothetical protein
VQVSALAPGLLRRKDARPGGGCPRSTASRSSREMRRAAPILVLLLIAGGCAEAYHASLSPAVSAKPTPQTLRQICVVRWNWMHYDHAFAFPPNRFVPATVRSRPCRIDIDYRLAPSDPVYRAYLGMFFHCALNRFDAYVCDSHARGLPGARPRRGQNARFFARDGTIRLNRSPARPVSVPKPEWVRRYPVTQAFVEPFDANGKLRTGLRFGKPLAPPGCATFPNIDRTTLIGCGAGLFCFVPRLPAYKNEPIACPTDRGSRVFNSGRLVVYRNP